MTISNFCCRKTRASNPNKCGHWKELQDMIQSVISEMDNLSRNVKDNAGKAIDGAQRRAENFRKTMAEFIEKIPGGES